MRQDCDGLVLCGGRARRFRGLDKGLLPIGDESAAERAVRLLRPHCARIVISANRNIDRYRAIPEVAVFSDRRRGFAGPLAALETLAADAAPVVMVLPCDLPRLDAQVPALLLDALRRSPQLDAVYATGGGERQYLCTALRRRALSVAARQLDRERHTVRGWLGELNSAAVDLGPALGLSLRNANTPEEWRALCGP